MKAVISFLFFLSLIYQTKADANEDASNFGKGFVRSRYPHVIHQDGYSCLLDIYGSSYVIQNFLGWKCEKARFKHLIWDLMREIQFNPSPQCNLWRNGYYFAGMNLNIDPNYFDYLWLRHGASIDYWRKYYRENGLHVSNKGRVAGALMDILFKI